MPTRAEIADELQRHIDACYYSEDFELISRVRAWHDGLPAPERAALQAVLIDRILRAPTLVEICLAQALPLPGGGPVLAALLDREAATSQLTRALIRALQEQAGEEAYRAVERFLDSDQEWDALSALARLDFRRTLPRVLAVIRRDNHLDLGLQIFSGRCKAVGWSAFCDEWRACAVHAGSEGRQRLRRMLSAKQDPYHPFAPGERAELMRRLEEFES